MSEYRYYGTFTSRSTTNLSTLQAALTLQLVGQGLSVIYAVVSPSGLNIAVNSNYSETVTGDKVGAALSNTFSSFEVYPNSSSTPLTPNSSPNNNSTTSGGTFWGVTFGGTTYTVKRGDTLGAIAARFNTTVTALARLNNISNPNLISVGQVLRINGTANAPVSTPRNTPVITGTDPTGQPTVTNTQTLPNPQTDTKFWDKLKTTFGVSGYVIGISALAVGLILLSPRK